jgi:hypothetical protein
VGRIFLKEPRAHVGLAGRGGRARGLRRHGGHERVRRRRHTDLRLRRSRLHACIWRRVLVRWTWATRPSQFTARRREFQDDDVTASSTQGQGCD